MHHVYLAWFVKADMPASQYRNFSLHHFHKGYYRGIITLRFWNYLHFAYSSSTFTTYSPNLSPFLSTTSYHLASQDVFPMFTSKETLREVRKTVTLSETGAGRHIWLWSVGCGETWWNSCWQFQANSQFLLSYRNHKYDIILLSYRFHRYDNIWFPFGSLYSTQLRTLMAIFYTAQKINVNFPFLE